VTRPEIAARRGRPPKSVGVETSTRLVDAAAAVCAELGFDGATLNEIAARAGVTPAAIYNHFDSREALLYAAGVRGLEQITAAASRSGADSARAIAAAYLRPELKQTRRLIAELHLAGGRDPQLAALLAQWHRHWAQVWVGLLPPDHPQPKATVKALYLLLLGLCHLDDLSAVKASPSELAARIDRLVDAIFPRV
jgi:AcrR family transcriptional regulator